MHITILKTTVMFFSHGKCLLNVGKKSISYLLTLCNDCHIIDTCVWLWLSILLPSSWVIESLLLSLTEKKTICVKSDIYIWIKVLIFLRSARIVCYVQNNFIKLFILPTQREKSTQNLITYYTKYRLKRAVLHCFWHLKW